MKELLRKSKILIAMDFIMAIILIFMVWVNGNYEMGANIATMYIVLKSATANQIIFDLIQKSESMNPNT